MTDDPRVEAVAEALRRRYRADEPCEREGHGGVDDDGFHRLLCARCHTAARIARQQS